MCTVCQSSRQSVFILVQPSIFTPAHFTHIRSHIIALTYKSWIIVLCAYCMNLDFNFRRWVKYPQPIASCETYFILSNKEPSKAWKTPSTLQSSADASLPCTGLYFQRLLPSWAKVGSFHKHFFNKKSFIFSFYFLQTSSNYFQQLSRIGPRRRRLCLPSSHRIGCVHLQRNSKLPTLDKIFNMFSTRYRSTLSTVEVESEYEKICRRWLKWRPKSSQNWHFAGATEIVFWVFQCS